MAQGDTHPDTPELDELLQVLWDDAQLPDTGSGKWKPDRLRKAQASLNRLLAKRELEGRIAEVEDFQWNDPHMYVHTRLAELREELAKYE